MASVFRRKGSAGIDLPAEAGKPHTLIFRLKPEATHAIDSQALTGCAPAICNYRSFGTRHVTIPVYPVTW